jgi:protease I
MAKIACVLAHGFEDTEFKEPYDAFRRAGHTVEIIGLKAGEAATGDKGKVTTKIERSFDDVRPDDYDALFIPGGHSPDRLRADDRAVSFVARFDELDRPIFAICHGPQLLMAAKRVKGRTLTAWKTVQDDLRQIDGVQVRNEEVVRDGNWITSRNPNDIPAFIQASLQALQAGAAAERGGARAGMR